MKSKGFSSLFIIFPVLVLILAALSYVTLQPNVYEVGDAEPADTKEQNLDEYLSKVIDEALQEALQEQRARTLDEDEYFSKVIDEALQEQRALPLDESGWRIYDDKECKVVFHVPPVEEPYYYPYDPNLIPKDSPGGRDAEGSGNLWDIPRGVIGSMFFWVLGKPLDYHQVVATFTSPLNASGYSPASVQVNCSPTEISNLSELEESLTKGIETYNNGELAGTDMLPKPITVSASTETKWGLSILKVTLNSLEWYSPLEAYMFVKDGVLYEVGTRGGTRNEFVLQTRQEILDKLVFY